MFFKKKEKCPVCQEQTTTFIKKVEDYSYYQCEVCKCIFVQNSYLNEVDEGKIKVTYDESYWEFELMAAKERAYGPALARMAETIYYTRRKIEKFLDIGTGPGYFLDAVGLYLPSHANHFYGVEKFPPHDGNYSSSSNYFIGDVGDLTEKFDAGICIEVFEHLTPKMVTNLLREIAKVSNPNALYIVNTGMPDFVLHEDMGYLDPIKRGHLVSWSVDAIAILAEPLGFTVSKIPGKTWAFVIEYKPDHSYEGDMVSRVWSVLPENKALLSDPKMGDLLQIVGRETALVYTA